MAVSKVILNGTTLIDTTDKTVTDGSMLSGITALKNDGTTATGSIASKTSSNLTVSGRTVTAPAGYYASDASKSVPSGSISIPETSITANPSISVDSSGLITATASASKIIYPSVTSGYVSSSASGTVTVSGSNTQQLSTQAAQTIHPSTNDQTIASGQYLTGAQTIKAVTHNLTADKIVSGFVAKIGDSDDDDCVTSVIGTASGGGGGGSSGITQDENGYIILPKEGGGGSSAVKKDVNFIDYDGTLLHSYTKAEIEAMTSESDLPANPSHAGLVAQGWNWTLAQIKAQLTAMPNVSVWVGQMYITESGDTEIDVKFVESSRLSPILTIAVNGTVTVDWGDGTTSDTVNGSSLTTRKAVSHTYANCGNYTISISVVSGTYTFYGSTSYLLLRRNTSEAKQNTVYTNCIMAVRLGNGITTIGDYAFYWCFSISYITIPKSIIDIGAYAFQNCNFLYAIAIPSGITNLGTNIFQSCSSLSIVSFPSSLTSISSYMFANGYGLDTLFIPNGVTSIGSYGVNCYSIPSLTVPSSVTSIDSYAFANCTGAKEYHLLSTIVPTGGSNMFQYIPSDCVIYVPYSVDHSILEAYKTATNWSAYASYMQEEPQ